MLIYIVDDEEDAGMLLERAIIKNEPNCEIKRFTDPDKAILNIDLITPDIIFLDISMPGISGLDVAKHVKAKNPNTNIIFCTGYSSYATDAFLYRASGYIMKPATADKVKAELNNLRFPVKINDQGIYIKTFDGFKVLVNGTELKYRRQKSKELLALLVDRNGRTITIEEIASYLFEGKPYDTGIRNQIAKFISDLSKDLSDVGAESIIEKSRGTISLNIKCLNCDLYDYRAGLPYAINSFKGVYMPEYSWAEETLGELIDNQ